MSRCKFSPDFFSGDVGYVNVYQIYDIYTKYLNKKLQAPRKKSKLREIKCWIIWNDFVNHLLMNTECI